MTQPVVAPRKTDCSRDLDAEYAAGWVSEEAERIAEFMPFIHSFVYILYKIIFTGIPLPLLAFRCRSRIRILLPGALFFLSKPIQDSFSPTAYDDCTEIYPAPSPPAHMPDLSLQSFSTSNPGRRPNTNNDRNSACEQQISIPQPHLLLHWRLGLRRQDSPIELPRRSRRNPINNPIQSPRGAQLGRPTGRRRDRRSSAAAVHIHQLYVILLHRSFAHTHLHIATMKSSPKVLTCAKNAARNSRRRMRD